MRVLLLSATIAALSAGCYNPVLFAPDGGGSFFCHPNDNPACPDGTTCDPTSMRCVQIVSGGGGGPIAIPKTGTYSGPHNDPGITADATQCPDASLEPNDSPSTAINAPNPVPDMTPPKITKMAICPTGPRPDTGLHDLDYYRVDASSFPGGTITLKANVFYDITQGDLDVGIFDASGKMLASDGTAVSDACVAASVPAGSPGDVYYVVVAGANNMDVNRYDIRVATFSTMQTCAPASTDGGI